MLNFLFIKIEINLVTLTVIILILQQTTPAVTEPQHDQVSSKYCPPLTHTAMLVYVLLSKWGVN